MATSIDVTWVKSVVVVDGQTKFRLQTTCSNPVGITDAALFMFRYSNGSRYLHVCSIGDMRAYYNPNGFPPIRRVLLSATGYVAPVPGDIGETVLGSVSGHTGTLVAVLDNDDGTHVWVIAPTTPSNTFQIGDVVTVQAPGSGAHGACTNTAADDKYRAATVTQDFSSPQDADEEKDNQETRLGYLITDWDAGYGSWPGTTSETIVPTP